MPEELKDQRLTTLEDKAWLDMEGRLDMVLPVNKGFTARERWLLALLLLLLIFTGGYIGYNELYREQEPPAEIQLDREYASAVPNQGSSGELKVSSYNSNASVMDDALQSNETAPIKEIKSFLLSDSENRINKASSIKEINPISKIRYSLVRHENLSFDWVKPKVLAPNAADRNTAFLSNEVGSINYGNGHLALNQEAVPIIRKYNKLCMHTIGLNAGLVTENIASYGGYEFGMNYYKVLNRKFSLRTGLDFQMFSKNGFINSLALASFDNLRSIAADHDETWAETRYTYDVENSEIINNEVGAEYIVGIVDQLYYLTIPVNLMYQFGNSRVFGGVNASLLLKGTNKVFGQDDLYFNTVVLSKSVLEKRNYFNRLDLGLELGVETKLWDNLYVYSKFNYGMFEIINADSARETNASFKDNFETLYNNPPADRIDFNRYFTVGVKYLINSCE